MHVLSKIKMIYIHLCKVPVNWILTFCEGRGKLVSGNMPENKEISVCITHNYDYYLPWYVTGKYLSKVR